MQRVEDGRKEGQDPPDQEKQEKPGANATSHWVPPSSQGGGRIQEGTGEGPQAHMEGPVFTTHMRRSRCVRAVGDSLLRGMEEFTMEPPSESDPHSPPEDGTLLPVLQATLRKAFRYDQEAFK